MDNISESSQTNLPNLPETFYHSVLQFIHDGVYIVNREREIIFWNKSAEGLTGYSVDDILGKYCGNGFLQHVNAEGVTLCEVACPLQATLDDGMPREIELFMKHKEGYRVPVIVNTCPVIDDSGKIIGAVESFRDGTSILRDRSIIKELSEIAYRDAVTGLYNRTALDMFLQEKLNHWEKSQESFGVLFIDLDNLKQINDQMGHAVGDKAIQLVGKSLSAYFREDDVVARWGGDEFLIILKNVNEAVLEKLVHKAIVAIQNTQVYADQSDEVLSASVGGTIVHPGDKVETLVARADAAMYANKNAKK